MAIPEWVTRLRTASFTSPGGVVSEFKLDFVSRIGGKKSSTHEILNTDEAIQQDQGNRSISYPLEAYFTGSNGDQEADAFFDSLGEHYSTATPGILRHPRWGDIAVMPFTYQQSEQLVTGAGVFRVPVEFREIPLSEFPTPTDGDTSEIVSDIDSMEDTIDTANGEIDVDDASAYAQFRALIGTTVETISNALGPLAEAVDDVSDTFMLIEADIATALVAGADAVEIMAQVNRLIRTPAQIVDRTINKVTGYYEMTVAIALSIRDSINSILNETDAANAAVSYQSIVSMGTAATAEAGLFTDFQTREVAGEALDLINDLELITGEGIGLLSQDVEDFDGDHNTILDLTLIIGLVNGTLIDRSFDLRAKLITILTGASDPISLTWRFYKDMEQFDFFIQTNDLQDLELIEIAAGREIVSYA